MTILEEALSKPRPPFIVRHHWDALQIAARRAERFVFSTKASDLIGRFVNEAGELVISHRQFALPPFNDTYIEFDSRAFHKSSPADPHLADKDTDDVIGYLISGKNVFTVAARSDIGAKIMPGYFRVVPPGEEAGPDHSSLARFRRSTGELEYAPKDQLAWVKLAVILGSTVMRIPDESTRLAVASEVSLQTMIDPKFRIPGDNYEELLRTSAGDPRNAWAFLLWLNRPKHTVLNREPARRTLRHGRQVTYGAHHTVEIDLGRSRILRRAFLLSGPRLSPRRHKVRGAFHHSGGDTDHGHAWPLIPDVDGHWKCSGCGRVRWWVKDHVRGDATRGWVDKDYAVKVEPEPV